MDKGSFEGGGSTMQVAPVANTYTPSVQAPMPISGEVIMSSEVETPVVQTRESDHQEVVSQNRLDPDNVLKYAKEHGIADTFKKLASGDDFSDQEQYAEEVQQERDVLNNFGTEKSIVTDENTSVDFEGKQRENTLSKKQEIVEYIAAEVSDDPLYKQKLGEVASEMIANGEDIDPQVLRDEAMNRFLAEKNAGLPESIEGKISAIEEEFARLLEENDELKKELQEFKELVKQQSETMNTMALALLEMAKKLHKEEDDEKEKITLFELLVKLMGVLLQEMVKYEGQNGKNQQGQQPGGISKKQQEIQLPKITVKKESVSKGKSDFSTVPFNQKSA